MSRSGLLQLATNLPRRLLAQRAMWMIFVVVLAPLNRAAEKRLADQITEYQEAAHDYVQDGIRLLELSKKAYFLYKQQDSSEKRKLLNFVCSNSI